LAATLGIRQPSLSKLEKQSDIQVSTLRKIVKALGGELEIVARFPKQAVRLKQFGVAGFSAPHRAGARTTELQLF
jgi:hypothetical protein